MTEIITDSIASLPEESKQEAGIHIASLFLSYQGRQIEEGKLAPEELLSPEVKTSAPSPGSYKKALDLAKSEEILILTASKELSASYKSAQIAAAEKMREAPSKKILVVDTQSAAVGQGLLVLAAARAAKEGMELENISKQVKEISQKLRLMGVLSDVSHLVKTGRIPQIAGWASSRLGLKPLFEIAQGKIRRMLPARSLKLGHKKIAEICRNSRPDKSSALHLAAVHSDSYEEAKNLESLIKDFVEPRESYIASFSQGLVVSAGKGVSGIAWWWE